MSRLSTWRVFAVMTAFVCSGLGCAPTTHPAQSRRFQLREYYFVLMRRGPTWTADQTPEVARLTEAHRDNVRALSRSGKLVLAGPFVPDPSQTDKLTGIFIFDSPTADEVKRLLEADPSVAAGRFSFEILRWRGPAGLDYDGRAEAFNPQSFGPASENAPAH